MFWILGVKGVLVLWPLRWMGLIGSASLLILLDGWAFNTCQFSGPATPRNLRPTATALPGRETSPMRCCWLPVPRRSELGKKKFWETRHPVYRGIRWRNSGKWVCEMREPNKKSRIWLGTFPTEVMAARAHDVAAIALRGRLACLNFADSAWRLPIPASDAKDIQKAAAEAAEAFRRPEFSGVSAELSNPEKETRTMPWRGYFMDEEDIFGMLGLLANMAEGLMLPPPPPSCAGEDDGYDRDDVELYDDVSLWSYSI